MKIREKLNQLKTSLGLEPKPLPEVTKPVKKEEVVPPDIQSDIPLDEQGFEPDIFTEPEIT